MSTIHRSYDWRKVSSGPKPNRNKKYPWGQWFDGRIWELEAGKDFEGTPASLERVIRTSANRLHYKVRIRILENGNIVLQRHNDARATRGVTRSPSKRSIREAAEMNQADQNAQDAARGRRQRSKERAVASNGHKQPAKAANTAWAKRSIPSVAKAGTPPATTVRRRRLVKV